MKISSFILLILTLILGSLTNSLAQNRDKAVKETVVNSEGRIVGHIYTDGSWSVCIGCGKEKNDSDNDNKGYRDRDRPDPSDYGNSSNEGNSNNNASASNQPPSISINPNFSAATLALYKTVAINGGFAKMVSDNDGQIPFSIIKDLKPFASPASMNSVFWSKPPDGLGHHYLTFNYLGDNIDMSSAWQKITKSIDQPFPFMSTVTGSNGQAITLGNKFNLVFITPPPLVQRFGGVPEITFPVTVTDVSKYTFTFTTLPEHWLRGSATHGIFKDSTGAVWLFQEGIGVKDEPKHLQHLNYAVANIMWARMSANVKDLIKR